MKTETQELIPVKKTKFVEMSYDEEKKALWMLVRRKDGDNIDVWDGEWMPINKIPQVIRGLFSAYQRFNKKGYVKKR